MLWILLTLMSAALVALFLMPGSTPPLDRRHYPNAISVLERVPIRGVPQWVLIRS